MRTMKRSAKLFLFPLTIFCAQAISAQTFSWEAPVDPVTKDGYYRILLQPDVTSQLRGDFSDVRIYDKDSLETAYVVYRDEKTVVDRFVTYQMVEKHLVRGCCSHITVRNSLGNAIDHIMLEVNNADVSRKMTLSGSYDGHSWYALRDDFTVESFNTVNKGERKTTSLIRFDFPLTDYTYYRFEFDDWWWWWRHDDKHHYPVFVVRAGYTEPTVVPEECVRIPAPAIVKTDSAKTKYSYVRITFPDSMYVDHLRFHLHAKKNSDYYRPASLFELAELKTGSGTVTEEIPIASTILSSMNDNEISLSTRRVKTLLLRIRNDDNQPLLIDSVEAVQVKNYLVAELEAKNSYVLRFGSAGISAPVYDLRYFKEKIPEKPPVIGTKARKNIAAQNLTPEAMQQVAAAKKQEVEATKVAEANLFEDRRVIWGSIGIVVVLLGFMTMKMLREMKEK